MSIGSFFRKLFSPIINIFRSINRDKAERIFRTVADLAGEAWPIVEMIARLTPNPTDDLVIAALKSIGMTASQIVNETNEILKDGARQRLAAEVLRQQFLKAIREGSRIKIGDMVLNTVTDVLRLDKTLLLTAIQSAYALWKLAR